MQTKGGNSLDNLNYQLIAWIALAVVFVVIEIVTVQLTTIWFAVGAVGAVVACLLGANNTVQLIVFVVLSLLSLVISRPYVKKFTKTKVHPTNADMLIGQQAVVTEDIDNLRNVGSVSARGLAWTARSEDGSVIEKDAVVTIVAIEGAKLIVTK